MNLHNYSKENVRPTSSTNSCILAVSNCWKLSASFESSDVLSYNQCKDYH